jgi:hypothetical protein
MLPTIYRRAPTARDLCDVDNPALLVATQTEAAGRRLGLVAWMPRPRPRGHWHWQQAPLAWLCYATVALRVALRFAGDINLKEAAETH